MAGLLARPGPPAPARAEVPALAGLTAPVLTAVAASAPVQTLPCTLWVEQHLQHIRPALDGLIGPATQIARLRRTPWWR